MGRKIKVWIGLLVFLGSIATFSALLYQPEPGATGGKAAFAALGDARALSSAFRDWTADHVSRGGDRNVVFGLGWSKGLSHEYSDAQGLVKLDMVGSAAQVDVQGLAPGTWDVWLVESRPNGSALPEAGDRMHRLGRLTASAGQDAARLAADLEPGFFDRFHVDQVVVTRAGDRPEQAVLFGAPDLFQRLYTKGRQKQPSLLSGHSMRLASLFSPDVANATAFDSLDPLVAQGANLFFNEKFGGNGRTCGTCHPSDNNFTIDPKYITTLAPDDPLFVAETNPALGQNFENPQLLRALGLVLENVDGFDDLAHKFVLRSVPHVLAMRNSRTPQLGSPNPPAERLGWAGDGAPGAGTLRDFALGAVTQHFTKSLNRVAGTDFRVPTNQELDALAAFQLALGRQQDLNLDTMNFTSPIVNRGKEIFNARDSVGGTVAAGKCTACHFNGGANTNLGENANFDIGVENLPDHPADLIAPGSRPRDGGFLRAPNPRGGFGNGRFNVPPLVEAADTGPFFHNNAVHTIEEAVDYYNSKAFDVAFGQSLATTDTGHVGIHLENTQVEAVAALLRVLNALENIRSSTEYDQAAVNLKDKDKAEMLLELASFDTRDAIQVLKERQLHLDAVAKLKAAHDLEKEAADTSSRPKRDDLIQQIVQLKAEARAAMVVTP